LPHGLGSRPLLATGAQEAQSPEKQHQPTAHPRARTSLWGLFARRRRSSWRCQGFHFIPTTVRIIRRDATTVFRE
jgi:hypothetical protein